MRSFRLILITLIACLLSFAQPYAITGVDGGVDQVTGRRPSRQDFSDFKNSGPAFDLYILSLQQLQQQDQTALLSYYQVAGFVFKHPFEVPFTNHEVKASMATRSLRGMASQVHIKAATVPMRPSSSLPGTDPTSRFSSNYYGPTPKELQAATRQPSKLNIKQRRHRSEFHTGTGLSTLRCPTPSTTP